MFAIHLAFPEELHPLSSSDHYHTALPDEGHPVRLACPLSSPQGAEDE